MVDPISIAVISSAAAAGLFAGKFSNKPKEIQPVQPKTVVEKGQIHFVSIKNEIDPNKIISLASMGESVFINIKDLMLSPQSFNRFINELRVCAKLNSLKISQISSEILCLTAQNQQMQIHKLSQTPRREIDDNELDYLLKNIGS